MKFDRINWKITKNNSNDCIWISHLKILKNAQWVDQITKLFIYRWLLKKELNVCIWMLDNKWIIQIFK